MLIPALVLLVLLGNVLYMHFPHVLDQMVVSSERFFIPSTPVVLAWKGLFARMSVDVPFQVVSAPSGVRTSSGPNALIGGWSI